MPTWIALEWMAFPALTSGGQGGLLLLAGMILLTAILLRRSYRRYGVGRRTRRRQENVTASLREHLKIDVDHFDSEAVIGRREVELHTLYRDCAARLDNKIVALEQLIRESEELAGRVEQLLERAERLSALPGVGGEQKR